MTAPNNSAPATPPAVPTDVEVSKFHSNADTDASVTALHHTLGIQHGQASPGDHNHNGGSSRRIGRLLDPSFPSTASATYNQSQIQSIINALRDLGFGT